MSKLRRVFVIFVFLQKFIQAQTLKSCDFGACNHEGQCFEYNHKERSCTCIGSKYFTGPDCSEAVDNCGAENQCENGGTCKSVVGQFICEDCNGGFGGHWCHLEIANSFKKLLLHFNHYAFYGQPVEFVLTLETVGAQAFSLELFGKNYVIDSFETAAHDPTKWTYSGDLPNILQTLGIRHHQDLPYKEGFYRTASETFWHEGLLTLTLSCYDTESATQLLYQNNFDLLIIARQEVCVPQLRFIYGTDPLQPLMLDIASYNNFEIVLENRCFENSQITYYWSIYNSIGNVKLHDFGSTSELILKIRPYKLWFDYQGEVMSSYRVVVKMLEEFAGLERETQARCFILVLPKPVSATIKGGNYREISVQETLILDASNSRDFALAPNASKDLIFIWHCTSQDDATNAYCKENMASVPIVKIMSQNFQVGKTYTFTLFVNSKVNKFISDQTHQIVKVMHSSQLSIDIECLRNCMRNEFIQGDSLHLKAAAVNKEFSTAATFKWFLEEQLIGEADHLIYVAKEDDQNLNIQIVVQDQAFAGQAFKNLKVNLAPSGGSCTVDPQAGQALFTNFHIKCENYVDKDLPISYEYMTEQQFPLQRTNEAEIITKLPLSSSVVIKICDPFQACTDNRINVSVEQMKGFENLEKFLKERESNLAQLSATGNTLAVIILLKSLVTSMETIEDLMVVIQEIKSFHIKTLLQVEQFLQISQNLVQKSVPLSAHKANVFNMYLKKLLQGLQAIVEDDEIATFKRLPYEKSSHVLLEIMSLFSQTWRNIPAPQILKPPIPVSSNPLMELNSELPDFEISIAQELGNWLHASETVQQCWTLLTVGAGNLYASSEENFSLKRNNFNLKVRASDSGASLDIDLNSGSVKIAFSEACAKELQEIFMHQTVVIHAVSLTSNPFWWYPSETPINAEVLLLSAVGTKTLQFVEDLKNPFEFQLQLKKHNYSDHKVSGTLKNNLHLPLYIIELPANTLLLVTFSDAKSSFKFRLEIDRFPLSFEVLRNGYEVKNTKNRQTFAFTNPFNNARRVYMALLLADQLENVTFSFQIEIRECVYWDFSLQDPQWSAQGCKPKMETSYTDHITCHCKHFSPFSARTYQSAIRQHLRQRWILKDLSINWNVIEFYFWLLVAFTFILLLNFYETLHHVEYVPLSTTSFVDNAVEIIVFTGNHLNASSSANISMDMISQKGTFHLTIYQDPENPFLQRNSMCKLLIDSSSVDVPLKLTLASDRGGRYPSWYCHKIVITNLSSQQKQIFFVDQWVSEEPLQVFDITQSERSFKTNFEEHLCETYINWFQFQCLWGCWQYGSLNRFERCCIELAHLMTSVCFLACYFGPTTMLTYEAEREMYYFLSFNILELLLLSFVCYLIHLGVAIVFISSMWLLHENYAKRSRMSEM